MKLLVLYVPGLPVRLAIRPDLAKNVSNLIELGSFTPLFPVFPALPGPMQASLLTGEWPSGHGIVCGANASLPPPPEGMTFIVLEDLDRAAAEVGPSTPAMADRFRQVDATIGELADSARNEGRAVVLVSDGARFPLKGEIDLESVLIGRAQVCVEEQAAFVRGDPRELAGALQSLDPGTRLLGTPELRALYNIDHPNAGDLVLIAPPTKRFRSGARPALAARGHLPFTEDDFGVLISTEPIEPPAGRRYMFAPEAGRAILELVRR